VPVSLPEQLLLSDLLRLRVRCDQGLDHGLGVLGWMHPPVHRLLGWVSRPSAFRNQRLVWRLDQLRGVSEVEAFVKGQGVPTEPSILLQLPTLIEATLFGADGTPLGRVADAAVQLRTGRIQHYLVARSDPRLPGSSRWRLSPDRIVDQQSGRVQTGLQGLDDLPLARASVRQELLRRSRRWRDQVGEETSRLRDQFQQVGDRVEERLEGWLEEPPWDGFLDGEHRREGEDVESPSGYGWQGEDPLEDWSDQEPPLDEEPLRSRTPRPGASPREPSREPRRESLRSRDLPAQERPGPDRYRGRDDDGDPWI